MYVCAENEVFEICPWSVSEAGYLIEGREPLPGVLPSLYQEGLEEAAGGEGGPGRSRRLLRGGA